jgi:nicotinate-nucleotide adenylyltransferase
MSRRVGIFSGTFDPVHEGHIAFAKAAREQCGLDTVFLLPELTPRGKKGVTDIQHRLAMLHETIAGQPGLEAVLLRSKQFTISETLPEIRRLCGDAKLTLLIGSDVVRTFSYRWQGLHQLFTAMSLAIGLRHNDDVAEITAIIDQLSREYDLPIRHTYVTSRHPNMSSSLLRTSAQSSGLHETVAAYIKQHNLYDRGTNL